MGGALSAVFYILAFALSAGLVGFGHRHKRKLLVALGLLIPIAIGGLRFQVGVDYGNYLNAYADTINPLSELRYGGSLEWSFSVISFISGAIFHTPIVMFAIYSAITVLCFYKALKLMALKNIGVAMFFFLAFFFLNSLNIMRQGAAISIGCIAMAYLVNGNYRRAILYSLLATVIHFSAIILIGAIIVYAIWNRRAVNASRFANVLKWAIASVGIVITAATTVVPMLGELILNITGRFGYVQNFQPNGGLPLGILYKELSCFIVLVLVLPVWKYFNTANRRLAFLVALALMVYSIGIVYTELARVGMYLLVFTPMLLAVIVDKVTLLQPTSIFRKTGLLVAYSSIYVVAACVMPTEGIQYKYQSVVENSAYQQKIEELGV